MKMRGRISYVIYVALLLLVVSQYLSSACAEEATVVVPEGEWVSPILVEVGELAQGERVKGKHRSKVTKLVIPDVPPAIPSTLPKIPILDGAAASLRKRDAMRKAYAERILLARKLANESEDVNNGVGGAAHEHTAIANFAAKATKQTLRSAQLLAHIAHKSSQAAIRASLSYQKIPRPGHSGWTRQQRAALRRHKARKGEKKLNKKKVKKNKKNKKKSKKNKKKKSKSKKKKGKSKGKNMKNKSKKSKSKFKKGKKSSQKKKGSKKHKSGNKKKGKQGSKKSRKGKKRSHKRKSTTTTQTVTTPITSTQPVTTPVTTQATTLTTTPAPTSTTPTPSQNLPDTPLLTSTVPVSNPTSA